MGAFLIALGRHMVGFTTENECKKVVIDLTHSQVSKTVVGKDKRRDGPVNMRVQGH